MGIPTVTDRVVQAALKLVLEPIFEADFHPVSFGFRPKRRAHDAIADIHLFGSRGYQWVLDADTRTSTRPPPHRRNPGHSRHPATRHWRHHTGTRLLARSPAHLR
ncbi:reverse transcriptase domain-containing protein [Amycolatopsis anabasis]|uniref:reverse transcriptase domain-containing protein n=1 Tax=Amycolatopsis anabasis TaxID=1840409 RepID=UPI001FEC4312|nr:reverse transcriptase domain-containing protein [Amycolatopsis anabasis]